MESRKSFQSPGEWSRHNFDNRRCGSRINTGYRDHGVVQDMYGMHVYSNHSHLQEPEADYEGDGDSELEEPEADYDGNNSSQHVYKTNSSRNPENVYSDVINVHHGRSSLTDNAAEGGLRQIVEDNARYPARSNNSQIQENVYSNGKNFHPERPSDIDSMDVQGGLRKRYVDDELQRNPEHCSPYKVMPGSSVQHSTYEYDNKTFVNNEIYSDIPEDAIESASISSCSTRNALELSEAFKEAVNLIPDGNLTLKDTRQIVKELREANEKAFKIDEMVVSVTKKQWAKKKLQKPSGTVGRKPTALDIAFQKASKSTKESWKEFLSWMNMWSQALKQIEGHFGTGVVSYFLFLRWLLFMNIISFVLLLIFVILPFYTFKEVNSGNSTSFQCRAPNSSDSDHGSTLDDIQDFLQGTGWMEDTAMFIGNYTNRTVTLPGTDIHFRLPLSYIVTNICLFLMCLFIMIQYTTSGVQEMVMLSEGKLHQYCNLVFSGWDYCITDQKTAELKTRSITQEVRSYLAEERREAEVAEWSRAQKFRLILIRTALISVDLGAIAASCYAVYEAASYSFESSQADIEGIKGLLIQFIPSISITVLNIVVPLLFDFLIVFENYSPAFQITQMLIRTSILRVASIIVLLYSLYIQIKGSDKDKTPPCWETLVGQQIYKLIILDFFVIIGNVVLFELPRRFVVVHSKSKLANLIGMQVFDIPKHVLDLVYAQALCWLGTFYSPMLPAVTTLKYFIFFYVQKYSLLNNCEPSKTPYKASRSNKFFMVVLMFSLLLAILPLAYALAEFKPSAACGPFCQRYDVHIWDVVSSTVRNWPVNSSSVLYFISSVGFAVPATVVLCLAIYYYLAVSSAHKHMERVLKEQLILEGKDKQFLLARLTEVAKQQANVSG